MNIIRFHPTVKAPEIPRYGDAGIDLFLPEDISIFGGGTLPIKLGFGIEIPYTWVGILKERSSIGIKGISVFAGVIDPNYRGELIVVLHNHSPVLQEFAAGDRLVQLLVVNYFSPKLIREYSPDTYTSFRETERGTGGFGSTGK